MTRRSIFKSLTACVVASALDVFGVKPKGILDIIAERIEVNPAYLVAEYEDIYYCWHPDPLKRVIPKITPLDQ